MIDLEPAPFRLRAWLDETMRALLPAVRSKGLDLAWNVAADLPDGLVGDAKHLRQVLLELGGNAVKFTEKGRVEVRVEREGEETGDVLTHFLVADTGMGIPPEKRELLFEAFTQGDRSRARAHEGIGLGLTLAARLVARMSGRLWVESAVGQGSTFHFTARFGRVAPDAFDRQAALARLGGDETMLRDAVRVFLEDCPRLVGQLREAVERRDAAAVRASAHAIKGTAAIFSAEPTVEAAARLERMGSEGRLAGLDEAVKLLEAELSRFETAVAALAGRPPS